MLSWVADVLIVVGLWKIGSKDASSFLWSIAGESLWVISAVNRSDWALASICCVFNVMALRNYFLWRKDEAMFSVLS